MRINASVVNQSTNIQIHPKQRYNQRRPARQILRRKDSSSGIQEIQDLGNL